MVNRQTELPRYSRMGPVSEIASPANDYNLNIPRYIDSSESEDLHDLDAHLNCGIPEQDVDAMQTYWAIFPSLRDELFQSNGRPGYLEPGTEGAQVKATILAHPEFKVYADRVSAIIGHWYEVHDPMLKGLDMGAKPKEIIHVLSEDLLKQFSDLPLINQYDVYQRRMGYWSEGIES